MNTDVFQQLLRTRGETCLSIVVPTHEVSRERRNDKIEIKNAIHKAKEKLALHTHAGEYKPLWDKLDELSATIDYLHNDKGLALYISPSLAVKVIFPFEVEEKIVIDDQFEWSELAYLVGLSLPYHLLLLSEKKVRLFSGQLNQLKEVHSSDFPDVFAETHEYAKPGRASSYAPQANVKGFEKDKSVMEEIRIHDYFRVVDQHLHKESHDQSPIIVAAPIEELGIYDQVTHHKERIVAHIHGNYTHKSEGELGELCFPHMVDHITRLNEQRVKDFTEAIGYGKGMQDIREIVKAAREGRVRSLLMEQNYHNRDYDINELLCDVYDHKGEVVVMQQHTLGSLPGLVALLRY